MTVSIITPAFNEAPNLRALHERIVRAMAELDVAWEWIIVDDHSRDGTFDVVQALALEDSRVRGVRLARNAGSHVAIACGLHQADGDAAVVLAADLQDPPETLRAMFERWRAGAHIVWATRRGRPGTPTHATFARIYYWTMRNVAGMREMPARGADFFLADRSVIEAFRQYPERHTSVLALITSLGFRQEYVEYDKAPRAAGQSGWTFAKKVKLVGDSVAAFSPLPIRACAVGGLALIALALVIGIVSLASLPSLGGGILFVLATVVGLSGLQLVAVGIVGEYVWRALEESRRRPQYVIEAVARGRDDAKLQ